MSVKTVTQEEYAKLGVVVHFCNFSTWEKETGGSGVQDYSGQFENLSLKAK